MQAAQLAVDLGHSPTPEEEFAHEIEAAIACCLFFTAGIGVWIARGTSKRHTGQV